jgi:CHAT domain-containing protein
VVGNPALDETDRALLAPLPSADAEARQVASLYPGGTLLVGKAATAGAFLAAIASADIVHFAGHALIDESHPLLSALVLAADPAGARPNRVTAFDLKQATMTRARLVVLGACRAAGGGAGHAGGAFNLARPFLAAGVPEVVGTLWAVRDREAGSILVDLHREYRRGSSAVEGLRLAQLAALRGPDPAARSPLSWGAYVVNGTVLRSGNSAKKEAS